MTAVFKRIEPFYLVLHGDSITDTSALTGLTQDLQNPARLHNQILKQMGNKLGIQIANNMGVGGKRVNDTNATAALHPSVLSADQARAQLNAPPAGYIKFAYTNWGANDIATPDNDVAIYAGIQTIVSDWNALGYVNITATPICRANITEQATMVSVGSKIRAGHADRSLLSDVLVDYGNNSHFDQSSDITSDGGAHLGVGWQDTVHPNSINIAIMAGLIVDAIQRWYKQGTPAN